MINHEEIRKALENEQKFVLVEEYRRLLRSLLEEVERMKADFEAAETVIKAEREENERITKERDLYLKQNKLLTRNNVDYRDQLEQVKDGSWKAISEMAQRENQQLREELEHLKKENEKKFIMNSDMVSSYENELSRLRSELEQVKKERDEWEKGELKHYSSDMEDTIQSLRSELVEKEMNAVCLRCFAKEVIQTAFNGGNLDGGEIQELGVKHHLLVEERYNPEKHGAADQWDYEVDPGDPLYFYTDILKPDATINESKEGETE